MTELPFQARYYALDKEDGRWWWRCGACGHDVGVPKFMDCQQTRESSADEKKARVMPAIQLRFKVVCERCETEMQLGRVEVIITIPAEDK